MSSSHRQPIAALLSSSFSPFVPVGLTYPLRLTHERPLSEPQFWLIDPGQKQLDTSRTQRAGRLAEPQAARFGARPLALAVAATPRPARARRSASARVPVRGNAA